MNPIRSIAYSSRFRAVAALLVLLVATGEARAEKKVVAEISTKATFGLYHIDDNGEPSGSFTPYDISTITNLFDGNLETGFGGAKENEYFIADFSAYTTDEEPMVYVTKIEIGLSDKRTFSLYVATNNVSTNATDWTAVAESVRDSGTKTYDIQDRIKAVKYVFVSVASTNDLGEFRMWGYRSSKPKKISKASLAKMYWADGTMTANNGTEGFGGGTGIGNLFNGNFQDSVNIGPNGRLNNGGYCQLDFSSEMPQGWFITEIKAGSVSADYPYSLYYSTNGTVWTGVDSGTNVTAIGKKEFPVNATAVFVKSVFDKIGGWTAAFSELEVWGMNPDDVFCIHPSYTPWMPLEGSASCLKNGVDEKFCTVCGKRVIRESSTVLMLGHSYTNYVERAGRYRQYGRGHIACTREDFLVNCPEPIDLITNRVNGEKIGGIRTPGLDHFTEVSVTSTGNTDWGVNPNHIINNNWTWSWNNYWYSAPVATDPDPHADYEFATELDLVYVDISLPNSTHTTRFYSVNDTTGEETPLWGFLIKRTDIETGDKYHIWHEPGSEEWEDIYGVYGKDEFDELSVVKDNGIPGRKHDENGNEIPDNPNTTDKDEGDNAYNNYQRFTVRFYETPIRHLRIRQFKTDGSAMKPMYISELHPWGTVYGAGELRYRKETIMILR